MRGDTVTKVWGHSWASAVGRSPFQTGRRRYELRVVARTGPLQLGAVLVEEAARRATWFSDACAGASFYVNGAGDVCTGRRKVPGARRRLAAGAGGPGGGGARARGARAKMGGGGWEEEEGAKPARADPSPPRFRRPVNRF